MHHNNTIQQRREGGARRWTRVWQRAGNHKRMCWQEKSGWRRQREENRAGVPRWRPRAKPERRPTVESRKGGDMVEIWLTKP